MGGGFDPRNSPPPVFMPLFWKLIQFTDGVWVMVSVRYGIQVVVIIRVWVMCVADKTMQDYDIIGIRRK